MIIKILQDESKSTSTSSVRQHNLLNCVECISEKEIYSSSGKESAWKEIRQNKHFKIQSKNHYQIQVNKTHTFSKQK